MKQKRKTKQKKAQMTSQIFVYVLAIIIIAFVLLYGYKSIASMRDKSEQIDLLSFKKDIENEVIKMSGDYGSSRIVTIKVPSKYSQVCFIDLTQNPSSEIQYSHPLIYEAWGDDSANVFLMDGLAKEFQLIQYQDNFLIEISPPGYLCIDAINTQIQFRLEGVGARAKLSKI